MKPDTSAAIEQLARAALSRAGSCADALCGLRELAQASAERAETLAAYLEGQVAVRAHALEQPLGQWWAVCDDCGPLLACTNQEQALRHALDHCWNTYLPVALEPEE
jgi:hypothetical protein